MTRHRAALWSVGIGTLAVAAVAASQGEPVEAPLAAKSVPAAETVEHVLRATYALPEGRARSLAEFLGANAAPGIEVRLTPGAPDRLTVVAPEDAQKALGTFIEKCLSKEPAHVPNGPTLSDDTFAPNYSPGPTVPNYEEPADGFKPQTPVRKRPTLAPGGTKGSPFMGRT